MRAGRFQSVRPFDSGVDIQDVDSEAEGEGIEERGEEAVRIKAEKEDEVVRKLVDPKLPSLKEVDDHWVAGHLPYRNWCSECVAAKGKDMDHQQDGGKSRGIPEYSFDYCFPVSYTHLTLPTNREV